MCGVLQDSGKRAICTFITENTFEQIIRAFYCMKHIIMNKTYTCTAVHERGNDSIHICCDRLFINNTRGSDVNR